MVSITQFQNLAVTGWFFGDSHIHVLWCAHVSPVKETYSIHNGLPVIPLLTTTAEIFSVFWKIFALNLISYND